MARHMHIYHTLKSLNVASILKPILLTFTATALILSLGFGENLQGENLQKETLILLDLGSVDKNSQTKTLDKIKAIGGDIMLIIPPYAIVARLSEKAKEKVKDINGVYTITDKRIKESQKAHLHQYYGGKVDNVVLFWNKRIEEKERGIEQPLPEAAEPLVGDALEPPETPEK